jgi:hypothetical protein
MDETEEKKEPTLANAMEQNHTHARSSMAGGCNADHQESGDERSLPDGGGLWELCGGGCDRSGDFTIKAVSSAPRGESTGAGGRWCRGGGQWLGPAMADFRLAPWRRSPPWGGGAAAEPAAGTASVCSDSFFYSCIFLFLFGLVSF